MAFYTTLDLPPGKLSPQRTSTGLRVGVARAEPVNLLNTLAAGVVCIEDRLLATERDNETLQKRVFALEALVETMMVTIDDTSERMRSACTEKSHSNCECVSEMSELLRKVDLMKRMTLMHLTAHRDVGASAELEH